MRCARCNRATDDVPFCSSFCETKILGVPSELTAKDFLRHLTGDMTGAEVHLFLGKIQKAGLVEQLNSHYATALNAVLRAGIVKKDGTVDLELYHEMRGH